MYSRNTQTKSSKYREGEILCGLKMYETRSSTQKRRIKRELSGKITSDKSYFI